MKILIIGGGAREHALGHSISKNKKVSKIYFAPGNAGCQQIGSNVNIKADDIEGLLDFAKANSIDLTVVGPEDPLCLGIVDLFEANNLRIFGPSKSAARLEGSKAYAKEFMIKHHIPTAAYVKVNNFKDCVLEANKLIDKYGTAVLKADTLCQGKGVFIANSQKEAEEFSKKIFIDKIYGECEMVVEEFLDGFEMSLLCFVDNNTIKMLPTAKDHKKIYDGEKGLNTGGMGTYSPNKQADVYLLEIQELALNPFLQGIKQDKLDFRGIIFIGFMIGSNGIKVLEFNTRFGDPETQSVLQRLETDLLEIIEHTIDSKLDEIDVKFNNKKVITLILASGGYPENYKNGYEITGLEKTTTEIFHAGTINKDGKIITNGGRVLSITSSADTFEQAYNTVYENAKLINFEKMYYRKDISPLVKRIYVEKKENFDVEKSGLIAQIRDNAKVMLSNVRCLVRYDLENISDEEIIEISNTILSESPVDDIYMFEDALELQKQLKNALVVQFHKGQYDQREQGLLDTIAVSIEKNDVLAKCSRVYSFEADIEITPAQMKKIENLLINPVDQERGSLLEIPTTLKEDYEVNHCNEFFEGFIDLAEAELEKFLKVNQLAMNMDDLKYVQNYFVSKKRNPSTTELSMIDTYWSDHCRHTTFNTILSDVEFAEPISMLDKTIKKSFNDYIKTREEIGRTKPVTLMDMATIVSRYMRRNGILEDMEVSEEINACSVKIKVRLKNPETGDMGTEDYLLMFKNETHNHPTEIEPFGGASTCIGGAIRDPLSGRSYVYQAMRVTGSADPRESIEDTLEGKLPQKKITLDAARGYSSYGNQIGLATGLVDEIYHKGYKAKRMEVGAVIGAAPMENVKREVPETGDIIVLLGGRTGRDGVGGATGSSKEHTEKSITLSSAEVQKGNAPMERKLQRLFRNEEAAKLIKKCNDFGAGGVSVAIGELADSLEIWIERVPLKYQGLTPREIAISESQERMAVVIRKSDYSRFAELCYGENLELTHVADVTDTEKLVMKYNDEIIVDLDREFLNSSGAERYQAVEIENSSEIEFFKGCSKNNANNSINEDLKMNMAELNIASKKNLIERFDSSIGKGSVIVPLGGKNQITPSQAMVATVPSLKGISYTASVMAYGFNPYLSEENPFIGAYYAVAESVSKVAATGADALKTRLSFQEYFERLGENAQKWGKPAMALLGAYKFTRELNLPPIGGKDSMSGTFKDISVPPTLISFAVTTEDIENIITPEFKGGMKLGLIETKTLEDYTLNIAEFKKNLESLRSEILKGNIKSCYAINHKGILPMLLEMSFGNDVAFEVTISDDNMYAAKYGSFIVEYEENSDIIKEIGFTKDECCLNDVIEKCQQLDCDNLTRINGELIDMPSLKNIYLGQLDKIFVGEITQIEDENTASLETISVISHKRNIKSKKSVLKPKVIIPVFPGTNCEWDTAQSFEREGGEAEIIVFNNLSIENIEKSITKLAESIKKAQILVFPGGFSLGDEPDGSGKFIANVIRNPKISAAIEYMLNENDGLILGICNGFQALIKTGLLPYGQISKLGEDSPTLTYNNNGRHIARIVETKAITLNSPWLNNLNLEDVYKVPVSHGEGRFVCNEDNYKKLLENDQIAFLYGDNPNGSAYNIEGIISPCGKILGKMAHSERIDSRLYKNIPDVIAQPIIKAGVDYFKK